MKHHWKITYSDGVVIWHYGRKEEAKQAAEANFKCKRGRPYMKSVKKCDEEFMQQMGATLKRGNREFCYTEIRKEGSNEKQSTKA